MKDSEEKEVTIARPAPAMVMVVSRRSTPEERRQQEKALDVLLSELVRQQLRAPKKG